MSCVTTSVGTVSDEPSKFACVIDTDQPDKVSPLSTLIPSTLNPYPYPPPYPAGPGQPGRNEYLLERSLGLFDVRAFDRPMWASVDDLVAVTLELEAPERHLVKFLLTC